MFEKERESFYYQQKQKDENLSLDELIYLGNIGYIKFITTEKQILKEKILNIFNNSKSYFEFKKRVANI